MDLSSLPDHIKLIDQTRDRLTLEVKDQTGSGIMDGHQVFPGMYLVYNDFKLIRCSADDSFGDTLFGVEHCREGKIEWQTDKGDYAYMGPGSLLLCDRRNGDREFQFPRRAYQGVTLMWDTVSQYRELPPQIHINMEKLTEKLHRAGMMDVSRSAQATYVLGLVYQARHQSPLHKKLACIEFLLFLNEVQAHHHSAQPLYFPKNQVMKIKQIEAFLTSHMDKRYTLEALSHMFSMPVTSIRRCFDGVFGCSASVYMKKRRAEQAMKLLNETDLSIAQIAASLGYENPSKFASAFRSETLLTPQMYRNQG